MKVFWAHLGFADAPDLEKRAGARLNIRFSTSMSVTARFMPNQSRERPARTLQAIIRGEVFPGSIVHSDGWKGGGGLVDVGRDKHFCINNKSKHLVKKPDHCNGIEVFRSFTKRHLAKFNGVKQNFELHLKECEWRYNRVLPSLSQGSNSPSGKEQKLMG